MNLVIDEAAVDSQSVETATMISEEVGYDAGKQVHGRKRHLSVDLCLISFTGFSYIRFSSRACWS
ncbi:MAG: hypothetical protein AAF063_34425 [Cyanobacteria bacterium J06643_5]